MKKTLFQAVAEVRKIETLSKGLRLTLATNEVAPEEAAMIFALKEKQGWFLFKESEIRADDVKNLPEVVFDKDEKTPSQKLRATIFRLWEKRGKPTATFDAYYRDYMEKIIEKIKESLN